MRQLETLTTSIGPYYMPGRHSHRYRRTVLIDQNICRAFPSAWGGALAADDLRQVILYGEEAVATAHRDDRSFYVYVLATLLTQRYNWTHNIGDLQRIILILEEAAAAKASDGDDPDLGVLEYLSSSLETKFDLTNNINDIRRVISYAEILVAAYPEGHPS